MTHLAKLAHTSPHLLTSYLVWLTDVDFWLSERVIEGTAES